MRNMFFRIISFVLVFSMMAPVCSLAIDVETDSIYTFAYEDRTIEVDAQDLTYEQAQLIADRIVYGENEVSTYGIFCLFGHKIDTTYAIETHHKEYATAPRCVRRTYRVDYCTRSSCSYSEATMTSAVRVYCCD